MNKHWLCHGRKCFFVAQSMSIQTSLSLSVGQSPPKVHTIRGTNSLSHIITKDVWTVVIPGQAGWLLLQSSYSALLYSQSQLLLNSVLLLLPWLQNSTVRRCQTSSDHSYQLTVLHGNMPPISCSPSTQDHP